MRLSTRTFSERLGISDRAVSKWESGATVPRADSQAILDTMLGRASADELARFGLFLDGGPAEVTEAVSGGDGKAARMPYSRTSVRGEPPAEQIEIGQNRAIISSHIHPANSRAEAEALDVDDVERRELLKIMGGMAIAAPLSGRVDADALRRKLDSAIKAPTTKSDVEEWERVAAQYSAESGLVPPTVLLPELLTDLDEAQLRLNGSPDALRAPMARVCGYLSALAAINFFNAGNERDARRYWRTALRIIDLSNDRTAQAGLYGVRAVFALDDGSPPSAAIALADDAISIAGKIPCAGAARGHVARATALAMLGEHSESTQTLHDLTDTFTRLPGATGASRGGWGYSEQELQFTHCRVFAYARRVSEAANSWEAGRALVPGDTPLASATFEIGRATYLIISGDPSEGARHVVRTVQALPPGYQQSALMRRKAARALDAVPAGIANVPTITEARELLSLP
jgi:hypothetical protein